MSFPAACASAFRSPGRSRSIRRSCCSTSSFSQLDHVTSQTLRRDFTRIAREWKKTCLLVTHRIDDALEMADRILVLRVPASVCLELKIDPAARADRAALRQMHARITAAMGSDEGQEPGSAAAE